MSSVKKRQKLLTDEQGADRFDLENRVLEPLEKSIRPKNVAHVFGTDTFALAGAEGFEPPTKTLAVRSSGDDLKALNDRWIQAFNDRDWKTEREVCTERFQVRLSGTPPPPHNDAWPGFMTESLFPDSDITIRGAPQRHT